MILSTTALEVSGLSVEIPTTAGRLRAVRDVKLTLQRGETLGIVGESGSGKSMTVLSILGLLPPGAQRRAERMQLAGSNLLALDARAIAAEVLGTQVGMIFQEPMTSLNPVDTIGRQLTEVMRLHKTAGRRESVERAVFLLEKVGIPDARARLRQYPHQLSGGLRQRVMIAMALMNEPGLLIADEPTTALDVTIQTQILDLLAQLQHEFSMSLVLISHDIGVIARTADRIAVMYAGEVVETGTTRDVLATPRHPYTQGLLACIPDPSRTRPLARLGSIPGVVPTVTGPADRCVFAPRCGRAVEACSAARPPLRQLAGGHEFLCVDPTTKATIASAEPLYKGHAADSDDRVLSARGIHQTFRMRRGLFGERHEICAVNAVDLDIHRGEILALVGESGCGKTTLSRILLGLQSADLGEVHIDGAPLATLTLRERARRIQPVFQDPYASLNPRKTIESIIAQPMRLLGSSSASAIRARTRELMDRVGLPQRLARSYPSQLSGGQRQRAAIARALITSPQLVICDEPTSALDVSVQAQILNLLLDLRQELGLTYLFITHNLLAVRHVADRVVVMYQGRVVETGPCASLFEQPRHPYTRTLLDAVLPTTEDAEAPQAASDAVRANPETPPAAAGSGGCAFHPRCSRADPRCRREEPALGPRGDATVRCFYPLGED